MRVLHVGLANDYFLEFIYFNNQNKSEIDQMIEQTKSASKTDIVRWFNILHASFFQIKLLYSSLIHS